MSSRDSQSSMTYHKFIRRFVPLILGLLACYSYGQSNFYKNLRPDATFVVRQHQMGSELVEVTIVGSSYPTPLMQSKLTQLGKEIGGEPWGLEMAPVGAQYVKASFACKGIVTTEVPKFNLAALARVFAFGDHPLRSFSVFFMGFKPDNRTPGAWIQKSWQFDSVFTSNPFGIEYRVHVDTDNPNDIFIGKNPKDALPAGEPKKDLSKLFIFGGIIIGALAVGLLVYSALLRPRRGR